ncbi:hypothetical protein [Tenacibaculum sp. 190524A02b]|uniref:Uncharacterized protein n=1 Tax=Tenacibaculum vairaonense TaxID=3137860 RepID=A0ABP1FCZ3_9FLAO
MKTVLLALFSIIMFTTSYGQESKILTATFDGHEDGVYYFSDNDDDYSFEKIEPEAVKAFDLKNNSFLNKTFKVAYKTEEEEDEFGNKYDILIIIKLDTIDQ